MSIIHKECILLQAWQARNREESSLNRFPYRLAGISLSGLNPLIEQFNRDIKTELLESETRKLHFIKNNCPFISQYLDWLNAVQPRKVLAFNTNQRTFRIRQNLRSPEIVLTNNLEFSDLRLETAEATILETNFAVHFTHLYNSLLAQCRQESLKAWEKLLNPQLSERAFTLANQTNPQLFQQIYLVEEN